MIEDRPNRLIQLSELGEHMGAWAMDWWLYLALVVVVLMAVVYIPRYKLRRRKEKRISGQKASLKEVIPKLKLAPGEVASDKHPGMPTVPVRRLGVKQVIGNLRSSQGAWTLIVGATEEPHILILGRSRHGKNEVVIDPVVWNCLFVRQDPVIINDVKGAVYDRFASRTRRPQYRYTFDIRHEHSAALNLIETPRMAEMTAAALYRIGDHGQIYAQTARSLFLVLAEYLGYGRSSIVDIYELASDRARLLALAKEVPALHSIIGGTNPVLVGDAISSLIAPLAPLKDEQNARVFGGGSQQPPLDSPVVVWIIIPQGLEKALGPLVSALLRNFYDRARNVPNPVRFVVDEAGSCLAFDDLSEYVSVAAGQGIYFALVLQSRSQLDAKIGRSNTNDVLNNCGYQWWGASNDPDTRHYVKDLGGTAEVYRAQYEHHGWSRSWRQALTSTGAPFEWRPIERPRIESQHVSLPRMWWYTYDGDPSEIALIVPPALYEYEHRIMAVQGPPRLSGVSRPQLTTPRGPAVADETEIVNSRDQWIPLQGADAERTCESCDKTTTDIEAVYCGCGSRLPEAN